MAQTNCTHYECWCGHECALAHELRLAYDLGRRQALTEAADRVAQALGSEIQRATRRPTRSESGSGSWPMNKTYEEYINSAAWAKKKSQYWKLRGRSCKAIGCDSTSDLEVHHHTYDRLGNESLFDLVGVCRKHRQAIHELHDSDTHFKSLTSCTEEVTGLNLRNSGPKRSEQRERASNKNKSARRTQAAPSSGQSKLSRERAQLAAQRQARLEAHQRAQAVAQRIAEARSRA